MVPPSHVPHVAGRGWEGPHQHFAQVFLRSLLCRGAAALYRRLRVRVRLPLSCPEASVPITGPTFKLPPVAAFAARISHCSAHEAGHAPPKTTRPVICFVTHTHVCANFQWHDRLVACRITKRISEDDFISKGADYACNTDAPVSSLLAGPKLPGNVPAPPFNIARKLTPKPASSLQEGRHPLLIHLVPPFRIHRARACIAVHRDGTVLRRPQQDRGILPERERQGARETDNNRRTFALPPSFLPCPLSCAASASPCPPPRC